jgi:hypothetical protein
VALGAAPTPRKPKFGTWNVWAAEESLAPLTDEELLDWEGPAVPVQPDSR